jgi:transaldolase/glucose-6-phosphate isomerase
LPSSARSSTAKTIKLPAELEKSWRRDGNVRRLWGGCAALEWVSDEAEWLGWLGIIEEQGKRINQLGKFAEDIRQQNFSHLMLLGMGGSSRGPEVLLKPSGGKRAGPSCSCQAWHAGLRRRRALPIL